MVSRTDKLTDAVKLKTAAVKVAAKKAPLKAEKTVTVAGFIDRCLATSDKPQKQIAEEAGFANPNVITLIKQGKMKIAANKVKPLAIAFDVDPKYLFRLVMEEYSPETWEVIKEIFGLSATVSEEELRILTVIRMAGEGVLPDIADSKTKELFIKATQSSVAKRWEDEGSLARTLNKLPGKVRGK